MKNFGRFVSDNKSPAIHLVKIVGLTQQIAHRIQKEILGIDINIHQKILIHIIGPANGHPL